MYIENEEKLLSWKTLQFSCVFLLYFHTELPTLAARSVGVLPHQGLLRHQLGVLQWNSILTLST